MHKNDSFFLSGNPQAVKPPVPKPRRCGLDELATDELLELIAYAERSIRLMLNEEEGDYTYPRITKCLRLRLKIVDELARRQTALKAA